MLEVIAPIEKNTSQVQKIIFSMILYPYCASRLFLPSASDPWHKWQIQQSHAHLKSSEGQLLMFQEKSSAVDDV
jgi:hypothetical protein